MCESCGALRHNRRGYLWDFAYVAHHRNRWVNWVLEFTGDPSMTTRRELANAIRALAMDAVQKANSGHPGAPMGMADIAEVLYNDFMSHNPRIPSGLIVTVSLCPMVMALCCLMLFCI